MTNKKKQKKHKHKFFVVNVVDFIHWFFVGSLSQIWWSLPNLCVCARVHAYLLQLLIWMVYILMIVWQYTLNFEISHLWWPKCMNVCSVKVDAWYKKISVACDIMKKHKVQHCLKIRGGLCTLKLKVWIIYVNYWQSNCRFQII